MVQDSYKTLEDYDKENKYLNISWSLIGLIRHLLLYAG